MWYFHLQCLIIAQQTVNDISQNVAFVIFNCNARYSISNVRFVSIYVLKQKRNHDKKNQVIYLWSGLAD